MKLDRTKLDAAVVKMDALSEDQERRIKQAIIETERQINRENTKYSSEHRDYALVEQYKRHLAKLKAMLADK